MVMAPMPFEGMVFYIRISNFWMRLMSSIFGPDLRPTSLLTCRILPNQKFSIYKITIK